MQSLLFLQSLAFGMFVASVFVDSSNILLLFYWYCVFEAGTDFGQIGPAVSAAVTAAARSSAPAKK